MNKKISIPEIGIAEVSEYIPSEEIEAQIISFEKQAEEEIVAKKQTENVHFRWSEFEIKRAKKIAEKLGYAISDISQINPETSYGQG